MAKNTGRGAQPRDRAESTWLHRDPTVGRFKRVKERGGSFGKKNPDPEGMRKVMIHMVVTIIVLVVVVVAAVELLG